jgi:hypothetical protein
MADEVCFCKVPPEPVVGFYEHCDELSVSIESESFLTRGVIVSCSRKTWYDCATNYSLRNQYSLLCILFLMCLSSMNYL